MSNSEEDDAKTDEDDGSSTNDEGDESYDTLEIWDEPLVECCKQMTHYVHKQCLNKLRGMSQQCPRCNILNQALHSFHSPKKEVSEEALRYVDLTEEDSMEEPSWSEEEVCESLKIGLHESDSEEDSTFGMEGISRYAAAFSQVGAGSSSQAGVNLMIIDDAMNPMIVDDSMPFGGFRLSSKLVALRQLVSTINAGDKVIIFSFFLTVRGMGHIVFLRCMPLHCLFVAHPPNHCTS